MHVEGLAVAHVAVVQLELELAVVHYPNCQMTEAEQLVVLADALVAEVLDRNHLEVG